MNGVRHYSFFLFLCVVLLLLIVPRVQAGVVGGLITTDTIWDISGSPYIIDNAVQIAYGVTLWIEPGVEVQGGAIETFGTLDVAGSAGNPVVFNGVRVNYGKNIPSEPALIQISYAEFNGGSVIYPTGFGTYGSLILSDSVLQDTPYIYLVYPITDSYIERNVFINAGGLTIANNYGIHVYIRNNYFYGQTSGYAVENLASYSGSTVVEGNSFMSTDRVAVQLRPGYTNAAMTAYNNYWGTLDETLIEQMIYDKNDNLSAADYIPYIPYLTDHDSDTPIPASLPPVSTPGGFPVSNIVVDSDTIWDISGSPYIIDNAVQIAYGVTLWIEPGVEVQGGAIETFGTLDVAGSAGNPVVFNGVRVNYGKNIPSEPALIQISYAEFNGGSVIYPTGFGTYGSLILSDSVLQDTPYIYLVYPITDSYIERNVFINAGGLTIANNYGIHVYIRNNYFYGQTSGYAVENLASYSGSTVVEGNSFMSTDRVAVQLRPGYTNAAMTAYNNYWGTLDETLIEQMIYDKNDNLSAADYIPYIPYLTDHDPDTPIPPGNDVNVDIDIKPGSNPNSINLSSEGVLPVAIFSSEYFDVTGIEQSSLILAGATAREKGKSGKFGSLEDVDGDGYLDLVIHFQTADLNLTEDDTIIILEGFLLDGTPITGTDSINVVP